MPVFNSLTIEANIHRIEGMADRVIWLNDDFIVRKPMCPSDYFDEEGKPHVFENGILNEPFEFRDWPNLVGNVIDYVPFHVFGTRVQM